MPPKQKEIKQELNQEEQDLAFSLEELTADVIGTLAESSSLQEQSEQPLQIPDWFLQKYLNN